MKKLLSILLALTLAFSSLGAGTAVFAIEGQNSAKIAAQQTSLSAYLSKQTNAAAAYLLSGKTSFDVTEAVDYLTYLKSGYDMSAYNAAFLASVKANLDANGGKLATPEAAGYKSEMGVYGAVIQILGILGMNASDFEGYNLVEAFEKIDLTASYHPYFFRVAIEAANETFAKQLCDKYIADFYVLGSGLNYWGFSCDNTAHFLTSIAKYKNDYAQYVDDAKALIKTYTKENGAFCDPQWAPNVNADSTALAMMAFASVGDVTTAFTYYKNLVLEFQSKNTGVFLYDGVENAYATKDALLSLEYFLSEAEKQNFEHPEDITVTTVTPATTDKDGAIITSCIICDVITNRTVIPYPKTVKLTAAYIYSGNEIQPEITVIGSDDKEIPSDNYTVDYTANKNVGTAKAVITFKGKYSGTIKKNFKINPKKASISSVTAKKNGFTVKIKAPKTQQTGYQVQYATDKGFSKNVKNKKISKTSFTASSLKANKKYFIRVRTYTKKGDKVYYSAWSAKKAVTTKK